MTRLRRRTLASLALLIALAVTPHALGDTGLAPVDPVSPNVREARNLYWVLLGVSAFILIVVFVPLATFIVRYRHRGERDVQGPQLHGNTRLELAWTAVPVAILVGLAALTFYIAPRVDSVAAAGEEVLEVRVEGRQFYWQYEYGNQVIAIDRLRVPVNRAVRLHITAPDHDVIHSFWVPPVGQKLDAFPGRVNTTEFRAEKVGVYDGACTEFCGLQHAAMLATVEVMPEEEFDVWLRAQAEAQAARRSDLGEQIWAGVCAKCHGPDVAGEVGPSLQGNVILADAGAVEQIVRHGQGAMPAVGRGWSDRQMDALTQYLRATQAGGADGG